MTRQLQVLEEFRAANGARGAPLGISPTCELLGFTRSMLYLTALNPQEPVELPLTDVLTLSDVTGYTADWLLGYEAVPEKITGSVPAVPADTESQIAELLTRRVSQAFPELDAAVLSILIGDVGSLRQLLDTMAVGLAGQAIIRMRTSVPAPYPGRGADQHLRARMRIDQAHATASAPGSRYERELRQLIEETSARLDVAPGRKPATAREVWADYDRRQRSLWIAHTCARSALTNSGSGSEEQRFV